MDLNGSGIMSFQFPLVSFKYRRGHTRGQLEINREEVRRKREIVHLYMIIQHHFEYLELSVRSVRYILGVDMIRRRNPLQSFVITNRTYFERFEDDLLNSFRLTSLDGRDLILTLPLESDKATELDSLLKEWRSGNLVLPAESDGRSLF